MLTNRKALIFLFLTAILIIYPLTGTAKLTSEESYFYIRRYIPQGTTERLLYNRTGPTIKTEYGLKNKFNLPQQIKMNLDFILQGSIIGITDPPEQWLMNLSFVLRGSNVKITNPPEQWLWDSNLEKEIWEGIIFKSGYGRQYDISKSALAPEEKPETSRLYFEIGFRFD